MGRQKLHKFMSRLHKWAGITVGFQVFLWVLGGFVMSWFDIEDVRGEHLMNQSSAVIVIRDNFDMAALDRFVSDSPRPLRYARAETHNGEPVFKVGYMDGGTAILDPQTAESLSPVSADYVARIAGSLYAGDGKGGAPELLEETGIEYRGPLPVWRVTFADDSNTSFYFLPDTGSLASVRTDLWRFYDFMWMLHIMDYDTRDDFNHPLLYLMALAALIFAISGFVLAWFRFTRRDFKWIRGS